MTKKINMELDKITSGQFKELLHKSLNIQFAEQVELPAELVEVEDLEGYSPLERKPFLIVFRTEQKTNYYTQGTFLVHHPKLGKLPIFLVPKGTDGLGMRYEAIFS